MKNILILSRDKIFAHCVRIILEDSGMHAEIFPSIPSELTQFDAALIDTETVKPAKLPFKIILSSYSEAPERPEYFLKRPFSDTALLCAVESAISGDEEKLPNKFVTDRARRRVSFGGSSVTLTEREFELFELLMKNTGRAVSRGEIIDSVFGGAATGNADAVYVNYLRKKLNGICVKNPIISVRGFGYEFKE